MCNLFGIFPCFYIIIRFFHFSETDVANGQKCIVSRAYNELSISRRPERNELLINPAVKVMHRSTLDYYFCTWNIYSVGNIRRIQTGNIWNFAQTINTFTISCLQTNKTNLGKPFIYTWNGTIGCRVRI